MTSIFSATALTELCAQTFDPDEPARRGYSFDTLDQLAIDHLLGVTA